MGAVAALGVLIAGWLLAPWAAMWRRGTLDQQTVRGWRGHPRTSKGQE